MDIKSLFNREEKIAGLEISDTHLRLSQISFNKQRFAPEVDLVEEEALPARTIQKGAIIDDKTFLASLANLLNKKGKEKVNYVILSLSPDQIFTKIYSFPNTIDLKKLKESKKLIVDYQLPFKPSDIYFDWEEIPNKDKKEFLLASISRSVVDAYIQLLTKAGLKTIAVEFHPISLLRSLNLPETGQLLISQENPNATYVYLIKDRGLRYLRVLPTEFVPVEKIPDEIKRTANFFEAENGKLAENLDLGKAKILEKYHSQLFDSEGKWSISLGAAIRGLLPRSEDKLISLMPIGTEKAYEYQRAIGFTNFIYALSLSLAIFFLAIYAGSWLLMLSLQQQKTGQVQILSSIEAPAGTAGLETRIQKLNALTTLTTRLVAQSPRYSKLLTELKNRVPDDITISSINIVSPQGDMTLIGVAATRNALNQVKKSLEDSPLIKDVNVPLTNLEQREKIPFSLSFKIENTANLYVD